MSKKPAHKWAFKPAMRAGLYGWRSSAKAAKRLKSATSEIKAVNRSDPIAAADGIVALIERIWPAFEHINTSSGALGNAVNRTLTELIPILINAPADEPTRAKWLERLHAAIEHDGVDYLQPVSDRFGEIAVYRSLQGKFADRNIEFIRFARSDGFPGSFVATDILTLSCLLEAGRYDELADIVALKATRSWSEYRYVAESLLLQGREAEALDLAESMMEDWNSWGVHDIARFCESILVRQGRFDDAYRRYGLRYASGNTYLAVWRDLADRYPGFDPRGILEDLMQVKGSSGKWFAAAKSAGFLDIALECAADHDAAPATLIRAARDFNSKEPAFAAQVAMHAIGHLVAGRGYEAVPRDVDVAVGHLMEASARMDRTDWALEQLRRVSESNAANLFMVRRLRVQIERFAN